MGWPVLIAAVGLLLVFEGLLPFLSPSSWRRLIQQIFIQNDRVLRVMGLICMLLGLGLVYLARVFFIVNK